ncbi:Hypothetical Protein FCC1311_073282 [Hondaea fermentalgiana]|uniref:Uncharacterized protein n=1 Tax=Hondaea fermentalgiana TaxID=2315210 RepID=A0A2R5GJP8_9STRA|nr:Hypothetical Protein FCC1311_073282 [Hondaea fermentalgiana]|eukprot:GBG31107.1 Hypothetical Protein FCC1311_073282 [Hondaea fermentalgiana]
MLRNVLVISSSGLLLFSKEFVNAAEQPRLLGSVITAMLEKAKQTTGLQLSYMEFSKLAITIVGNEPKTVFCVLFHDCDDGEEFGKLLATEILGAFLNNYRNDLKSIGLNQNAFQDFQFQLSSVIQDTGRPVLDELKRNRAVVLALLVKEDPRVGDSCISYSTGEVDQFGVLANLKPLISAATDIMSLRQDSANAVWLESTPTRASRLLVQKVVVGTYLVIQFSMRFDHAHYEGEVVRATRLLEKVCMLGEMMKRNV